MSCGVDCRHGWDPGLPRRPTAASPIRPLAWELPYATGVALKKKKKAKTNKAKKHIYSSS